MANSFLHANNVNNLEGSTRRKFRMNLLIKINRILISHALCALGESIKKVKCRHHQINPNISNQKLIPLLSLSLVRMLLMIPRCKPTLMIRKPLLNYRLLPPRTLPMRNLSYGGSNSRHISQGPTTTRR